MSNKRKFDEFYQTPIVNGKLLVNQKTYKSNMKDAKEQLKLAEEFAKSLWQQGLMGSQEYQPILYNIYAKDEKLRKKEKEMEQMYESQKKFDEMHERLSAIKNMYKGKGLKRAHDPTWVMNEPKRFKYGAVPTIPISTSSGIDSTYASSTTDSMELGGMMKRKRDEEDDETRFEEKYKPFSGNRADLEIEKQRVLMPLWKQIWGLMDDVADLETNFANYQITTREYSEALADLRQRKIDITNEIALVPVNLRDEIRRMNMQLAVNNIPIPSSNPFGGAGSSEEETAPVQQGDVLDDAENSLMRAILALKKRKEREEAEAEALRQNKGRRELQHLSDNFQPFSLTGPPLKYGIQHKGRKRPRRIDEPPIEKTRRKPTSDQLLHPKNFQFKFPKKGGVKPKQKKQKLNIPTPDEVWSNMSPPERLQAFRATKNKMKGEEYAIVAAALDLEQGISGLNYNPATGNPIAQQINQRYERYKQAYSNLPTQLQHLLQPYLPNWFDIPPFEDYRNEDPDSEEFWLPTPGFNPNPDEVFGTTRGGKKKKLFSCKEK